ncbi:hypothetical protein JQN72_17060 [Phycicoccus sp. CSK15P-2]|uniref:hypothetical protein n=1 Tax=Phycicoccus sp. CSK15P-2 TaxID=2807627 RepID=UPI00195053FD|nr:hypothetical protein [Phycicoccus sp. CSK15P-2]MBM6405954.1 hypothetical protein [Phycicoccus sp. CSK15P-2]
MSRSAGDGVHTGALGTGAVVASAMTSLIVLAAGAARGLDFWDESYTLLLVDRPDASYAAGEVFLFQFLLHPVFVALGRDVALLRLVGFLMLVLAAVAATRAVGAFLASEEVPVTPWWSRMAPAVVAATTPMAFIGAGRVPTYRVVVVIALLVVVWGVCRMWASARPEWGLLVGAALVVTFTGKPPSALAAGVVVALAVAGRGEPRFVGRAALYGLLGAIVAVSAVLVASGLSPLGVVAYLQGGLEMVSASGTHSSWWTMLGFAPVSARVLLVFGPLLVLPLLLALHDSARRGDDPRRAALLQVGMGILAPAVAAVLAVVLLSAQGYGSQVQQWTFLWGIAAALLLVVSVHRASGPRRLRAVGVVLLLLSLPYAATVGTNTNFAQTMTQAAAFWALAVMAAGLLLAREWPPGRGLLLPLSLWLAATTVAVQVAWFADREEGISLREDTVQSRVLGGSLWLEPDSAELVSELSTMTRNASLTDRPAIDLTGYGAGYELLLGARPLGRASFFGTFDGAYRGARLGLERESCRDRAEAVVLVASHNPLDVSAAVQAWGLNLDTDYTEIGRFRPTHGGAVVRSQTVRVLLPTEHVGQVLGCPHA